MFDISHSPTFVEDDDGVVQETSMDVLPVTQRPLRVFASVTEIPRAFAQSMRMNEIGSFKPSIAIKALRTGAMSRELVDKTARIDGAGTSNFTVVLFLLGLICPPFLLCGCRYLSSPSKDAKMLDTQAQSTKHINNALRCLVMHV